LVDELLGVDEAGAGVLGLGVDDGVDAGDDELSVDKPLFSDFDPASADAAGLSAFSARSDLPPSDFGADPFSPFG